MGTFVLFSPKSSQARYVLFPWYLPALFKCGSLFGEPLPSLMWFLILSFLFSLSFFLLHPHIIWSWSLPHPCPPRWPRLPKFVYYPFFSSSPRPLTSWEKLPQSMDRLVTCPPSLPPGSVNATDTPQKLSPSRINPRPFLRLPRAWYAICSSSLLSGRVPSTFFRVSPPLWTSVSGNSGT